MNYKQIVFDVDGTLIDTEYAIIHSLQDTIKEISGKIIPVEELTFALGITGKAALQRLEIADITTALFMWDKNMGKYRNTVSVFDGIKQLLALLTKSGYNLGIVTSKTWEEFKEDFINFDISSYFKTVVCADDTVKHKPDPAPLLKYMELTSCESKELLYIGDSVYDMECSQRANTNFGLAKWGAKNRVETVLSFTTPSELARKLTVSEIR